MKKIFITILVTIMCIYIFNDIKAQTSYYGKVVPYPTSVETNIVPLDMAQKIVDANQSWNKSYGGYYRRQEPGTQKNNTKHTRNLEEERLYRRIGFALGVVILFLFRWLLISAHKIVQNMNQNYIEPARERHQNLQEQYRKYLRDCDKKGKQSLSYAKWKFVYKKNK